MKYWEAILEELRNKEDKTYPFVYTNLGTPPVTLHQVREANVAQRTKNMSNKMYFLGERYPNIYFTRREAQTSFHLLKGHTIVDTAKQMKLSPRTVEFYVKNMKTKVRCKSKRELLKIIKQTTLEDELDFEDSAAE